MAGHPGPSEYLGRQLRVATACRQNEDALFRRHIHAGQLQPPCGGAEGEGYEVSIRALVLP
jgi:hypothetical protein